MIGFELDERKNGSRKLPPRPAGLPSFSISSFARIWRCLHVRAAAERPAVAGDDADLRVVVIVQPVERVAERDADFVGERVQLLRAIQRDVTDAAFFPVLDQCHRTGSFR